MTAPRFSTVSKADDDAWRALDRAAQGQEPALAAALRGAFAALAERFDAETLAWMASGRIEDLLDRIDPQDAVFDPVREALAESVLAAARTQLQAAPFFSGLTLAVLTPLGSAILIEVLRVHEEDRASQAALAATVPLLPPPPERRTPALAGPARDPKRVVVRFDALHPRLTAFLRRYELDLIREITDSIKEGIRAALTLGMEAGWNPRTTARHVRQVIGLTARQQAAVGAYRKELETFHMKRGAADYNLGGKISRAPGGAQTYAYAGAQSFAPKDNIKARRLRDFRYDRTLIRAMDEGKPLTPAQVDKMTAAYARKYLRYRSETIATTEALRATNQGVLEAWEQAAEIGLVDRTRLRKRWITALGDERLCPVCRPMPHLNRGPEGRGIPMDARFTVIKGRAVMTPPLHPRCRCVISIRPL